MYNYNYILNYIYTLYMEYIVYGETKNQKTIKTREIET